MLIHRDFGLLRNTPILNGEWCNGSTPALGAGSLRIECME